MIGQNHGLPCKKIFKENYMKTSSKLGYDTVVADIPNKGYCKITLDNAGVIVKAYVGPSKETASIVYSSSTPDSCWKSSMQEMISLSPSCFIELFHSLKSAEQLSYASELIKNQSYALVCSAHEMLNTAYRLDSLITVN